MEYRTSILRVLRKATPEERALGADWYPSAGATAEALVAGTNLTPEQGAGIIAALSPRCRWSRNVEWAARIVAAFVAGEPCPAVSTGANRRKAWAIASGDLSPLSGRKVRSFVANLTGDTNSVTVDAWAARAAGHHREGVTPRQYDLIAAAYRSAARAVGMTPSTAQATAWIVVRGNHE